MNDGDEMTRLVRVCGRGVLLTALLMLLPRPGAAGDRPQWGERFSRNMVSDETDLPDRFDPKTGQNVKWSVPLGTECYATPVVAGGRVLLGTNNDEPRDPRHQGDRGVLMCFNEADGKFLWQLVVPKLEGDIFLDWPHAGMCSPATVEGDRVYTVTNRDEVVCLDTEGFRDNENNGPFKDEKLTGPNDADIIWSFDMIEEVGSYPHNMSNSSPVILGDLVFVSTSTERELTIPIAPSASSYPRCRRA